MSTPSTPNSRPPKPTELVDKVRELTIGPFCTGVMQGFISVAVRRYKEKRALRKAAQEEKKGAEGEDLVGRTSDGGGVVAFVGGDGEISNGD